MLKICLIPTNFKLRKFVIVLGLIANLLLMKSVIRWIDLNYYNENIYDTWGSITTNEDWSKAQPLPKNLDKSWLASRKIDNIYYIAHALGGSGTLTANTYAAFEESRNRGFKLYEVDIFLDEAGHLRCYHGPDTPSAFNPKESCILDTLLPMIDKAEGWVVLDIKTDFQITGNKIIDLVKINHLSQRVIFQLYHPDELSWFSEKARQVSLPVPIVTVYESKRSANHIANHTQKLNIDVLTVPFKRLRSMKKFNARVKLFTHPIHNCKDWEKVHQGVEINGIYALSSTDIGKCK
jgi:glycerophosphoryl diester phosphodiesterase